MLRLLDAPHDEPKMDRCWRKPWRGDFEAIEDGLTEPFEAVERERWAAKTVRATGAVERSPMLRCAPLMAMRGNISPRALVAAMMVVRVGGRYR